MIQERILNLTTMTETEKFYSRHNFHTDLYYDIGLLKDNDVNSVRESIGYRFVVPVHLEIFARRAGENIGKYNSFEPDDAVIAFEMSDDFMYIGYEYSPVIYIPLDSLREGMLPYADEVQIIMANDGVKYLRLWWD